MLVRPRLGPGTGWSLSGTGDAPCWAPLGPPRSHSGGVIARSGPGSSAMEEVAVAATTGDNTSLSVSLELGSAVAGMSGLGPEGSSSILRAVQPLVLAAPAALAEAATTPWTAAGSRSRQRHFPPFRSRESGGGTCALRSARGRGLRTGVPLDLRADPGGRVARPGQS